MLETRPSLESIPCEITQAKKLGGGYFLITMIPAESYRYKAGQYVEFHFKDEAGIFKRYYSIANAPNSNGAIQFCIVMIEERVNKLLERLKLGDTFYVSAAHGKFILQSSQKPVVLIAGGSGISPIRAFFQQLTDNFNQAPRLPLHLVYGCKHSQHIPGKEEFLEFSKLHGRNLKLWLVAETVERDTEVNKGTILDYLPAAILPGADYYLCGPRGMIENVKLLLAKHQVPAEHVFQENY